MAVRKVRRKPKKKFIVILVVLALALIGFGCYITLSKKTTVKEAKVVSKIPGYGYTLKSNKSKEYKKLFQELKKVLTAKKVDEKKYAKVLSKMFVVDFYSLGDHIAKTDVGGVEFVYKDSIDNFLENAEDTYYKYVENNIYGARKQKLPIVKKAKVVSVSEEEYAYNDQVEENAYKVVVKWSYKDKTIADGYQDKATLVFIHDGKKLVLVEALNGNEKYDSEDTESDE